MITPERVAPAWHKDAKWVSGILLFFALGVGLLLYNLAAITKEKPAVEFLSSTLAVMLSPKGLDDETEIVQLRQVLKASPNAEIRPIPGLPVTLREQDIAGLSPRQVRLYLGRQVAEPFYRNGSRALSGLSDNPEIGNLLMGGLGPLGFFTLESHQTLQRLLQPVAIAALVLLGFLLLFSHGFGRIGSPGFVLLCTSLPGAILVSALAGLSGPPASPPVADAEPLAIASYVASNSITPLLRLVADNYLYLTKVGAALIVAAILADFLWSLFDRGRRELRARSQRG